MLARTIKLALVGGALVLSTTAIGADASGAMTGRTCAGCHGTDGVSKGAAPSIKGLPASYLGQAMKDFKSGARPGTIMGRIAKGYSDKEIDAMAQYFSNLK
jgi:cytochrome c553